MSAPGPAGLVERSPITVNFHPDRLVRDGLTVVECLAAEGVYRSQFETGISNGGLGGPRAGWEERMFPGMYTGPLGRPVYGGLNLAGYPDGASPRFGSCHLILRPGVAGRATFSLGDSVLLPTVVGTADAFGAIWAALRTEVADTGSALNLPADSPDSWAASLAVKRSTAGRALDNYVEAQIHGGLTLSEDVAAVVADPSFRGTPYEAHLAALSETLLWSPGFTLTPAEFPAALRGPEIPPLAEAIAGRYAVTTLDAEIIGRAAREPGAPLQLIKYLWHILVLLGRPAC
ncbi:DUF3626 domain-containing protein [Actinoplanes subtropicus]|uniref:DUF3626 domain-containing protein n=1 Tax=Actinoplanes subtropicus TaxID=543632 RepID=UPI00069040C8|nr:DUF3626 domain-containing protein [Actinoplanes subtropicus]